MSEASVMLDDAVRRFGQQYETGTWTREELVAAGARHADNELSRWDLAKIAAEAVAQLAEVRRG